MPAEFWSLAAGIDAAGIAARIPHAGTMCLLQSVQRADAGQLVARASSHRNAANPLARDSRLGAACGVEYAAQAMALHGALQTQANALAADGAGTPPKARAGYLVNVRNLALQVQRLDDIGADLLVQVRKFDDSGAFTVYDFEVSADEAQPQLLLGGRAYVMLQALEEEVVHGR